MNISTGHILQCNQSEPLADASGRIVDLMSENGMTPVWIKINICKHCGKYMISSLSLNEIHPPEIV